MKRSKSVLFLEMFLLLVMFSLSFFVCQCQFRDPFYLSKSIKSSKKSDNIKVLGIIESSGIRSAILFVKGEEQVIFEGDEFGGLRVSSIKIDRIAFSKGKKHKVLFVEK